MADTVHNMQVRTTVKDLASRELRGLGKTGASAGKSIAGGFLKAQLALAAMKVALRTVVRAIRSVTTEFGETADRTAKLARQLGVGIEGLSEMGNIAEFAGANLEDVAKSVRFVQRSMAEAQRGTLTYKDAFDKLGITSEDINRLMGLDGVEAFQQIGLKISEASTQAEKINASMVLMGRAGTSMIPIFEQGAEAINKQRLELKAFGVTLTSVEGKMAEDFQDARKRFNDSLDGIRKGIATKFVPILTKALNRLANWVKDNREQIIGFFIDLADAMLLVARASGRMAQAASRAFDFLTGKKETARTQEFFNTIFSSLKRARELLEDLRKSNARGGILPGAGGGGREAATDEETLVTATRTFFARLRFGTDGVGGIADGVRKIREQLTPENLGLTTVTTLTNAWTGFFDAITFGSQKAEDAFRNMASSMLRQLAQMANQALFAEIIGAITGTPGATPRGPASADPATFRTSSGLRTQFADIRAGGLN